MVEPLKRQPVLHSKLSAHLPYPSHAKIKSFIPKFKGAYTACLTRYDRLT